jgi:hypothetical protein
MTDDDKEKLNGVTSGRNHRRQAEIIPLRDKIGETRGDTYSRDRIKRAAERDDRIRSAKRGGTEREQRPLEGKAALKGKGAGSRGVTAKEEAFALSVAQGSTLSDAYRKAYDVREGTKPQTIWTTAYAISERQHVAERISYHVERLEREKPHDDAATRRMVRDYLVGVVGDNTAKTSDRTRAAELLGKVGGVSLFSEPKTVKDQGKPQTAEQLAEALEGLLATVRAGSLDKTGT